MVRAARLRATPQRAGRASSNGAPSQAEVGSRFEVIVFTASLAKYADPLLDLLDRGSCVRWRLFRESCYPYEGNYVKDLTCLGRPLKDVIIVDNSPHSYIFHPFNAVRHRRGFPLPRAHTHERRFRSAGAHLEFYRRHVGARFAGPAAAHAEPGGGGGRHHGHSRNVLARRDAHPRQIAAYYARCGGAIKRVEPDCRPGQRQHQPHTTSEQARGRWRAIGSAARSAVSLPIKRPNQIDFLSDFLLSLL